MMFSSSAITCPFGEQSNLPSDDDDDVFGVFEVITPDGTQPENVLRGSEEEGIPVDATQSITITVTDEPFAFVVMDIMYDSDVPTRVIMFTSDGRLVPAQNEPVSFDHLEIWQNKVRSHMELNFFVCCFLFSLILEWLMLLT